MSGAALVNTAGATVTLAQWLRLLWNISPPLRLNSDGPFITAGEVHLPPRNRWLDHTAAAAHAAAHLVYSPRRFDGAGLAPRASISRAIMGLLEDARAEALAMRDLPGLARLWRPWHTATPELGNGFEALMQRLARALIDPGYDDPDPWVAKGRALFRGDGHHGEPALRTPADVHQAATRLGHDIGQMRLQFNAKTYRPMPAYRDDHRWMWPAEVMSDVPPPAAALGTDRDAPVPDIRGTASLYPEWDRLIARLRPDWCRVLERDVTEPAPGGESRADDTDFQHTTYRLRRALRALSRHGGTPQRDEEGERFDPAALVDRHIARRLRRVADPRIYRGHSAPGARASVWLLIDQSASTAALQGEGVAACSVLHLAAAAALVTAGALQATGIECAIAGFCSRGRHAVEMNVVKPFDAPADSDTLRRAQALRPGGSTRLGAALRHATRQLMERHHGPQWVIVLSDGEPYDVDVHDPHYLAEDARHAVRVAARCGVHVVCSMLARERSAQALRIFGRHGVQLLQALPDLPRVLTRLII